MRSVGYYGTLHQGSRQRAWWFSRAYAASYMSRRSMPLFQHAPSKRDVVLDRRRSHEPQRRWLTFSSPNKLQPEAVVTTNITNIPSRQDSTFATITICNPYKLNTLSPGILKSLIDAFTSLKDPTRSNLRAVVLTSQAPPSGKAAAFIGGADIGTMASISSPKSAREFISLIHSFCKSIRQLPVPVIGAANGFCLGAGLEIFASCDLRCATRASIFGMPEVRLGIPSVVEARLLPDLIGWGPAKRMLLLGENFDAETVADWGLLDALCADQAEMDNVVERMVGVISDCGPKAVAEQKRLMYAWQDASGVSAGIEMGIDSFASSFKDGGDEPRRMMNDFLSRPKVRK